MALQSISSRSTLHLMKVDHFWKIFGALAVKMLLVKRYQKKNNENQVALLSRSLGKKKKEIKKEKKIKQDFLKGRFSARPEVVLESAISSQTVLCKSLKEFIANAPTPLILLRKFHGCLRSNTTAPSGNSRQLSRPGPKHGRGQPLQRIPGRRARPALPDAPLETGFGVG